MKLRFVPLMATLVVISLLVVMPVVGAKASTQSVPPNAALQVGKPDMHFGATTSLNWAGYVVTSTSGAVTDVKGSWTVPSLVCSGGSTYAAFWVGIDGFTSNTVEQTGVLAECSHNSASYSAWYEFYPNPSVTISSMTVSAKDSISADVSYSSTTGQFTITITDGSQTYSNHASVTGAARNSAEWIVERPALCTAVVCRLTTLANFGSASFGNDAATIGGTTNTIDSFPTQDVQSLAMVDSSGTVLAQPSPLSLGGSFTVSYGASTATTTSSTISSTISSTSSSSITTSSSTSTTTTTSSSTHGHGQGNGKGHP